MREPQVTTRNGVVKGAWITHVSPNGLSSEAAVFRGIPYAKAPVGPLRFDVPHPASSWDGVRDATLFGPTPQRKSPYEPPRVPEPSIPGDETLTVNVTTPSPGERTHLPVLVYIHGGGFIGGSPASPWYVGEAMARDGVVTVTFGYRLGFEGFAWLDDAPCNRGVRDWIAALEWVRDNIHAFGGDPSRVTIAGQSAGGAAVMRLLTMEAAQGLFHGAIALSPADASSTAQATKEASLRIASACGTALTVAEASEVSELALFDARDLALDAGAQARLGFARAQAVPLALGPCVDGEYLTESVTAGLRRGVGGHVPLLIGACLHEFNQLVSDESLAGKSDVEAVEGTGLSPALAARYADLAGARGPEWAVGQVMSDAIFRSPVAAWSSIRASQGAPTWTHDFRWESGAPTVEGAAHCVDLPFGFDILGGLGVADALGEAPQELADAVHTDWLAFVTTGRVEAPQRTAARETIVYTAHGGRAIEAAYEREELVWDELRGE